MWQVHLVINDIYVVIQLLLYHRQTACYFKLILNFLARVVFKLFF